MQFADFASGRPDAGTTSLLLVCLTGNGARLRLPVDAFPKIDNPGG